jgi:hypothetical protein
MQSDWCTWDREYNELVTSIRLLVASFSFDWFYQALKSRGLVIYPGNVS